MRKQNIDELYAKTNQLSTDSAVVVRVSTFRHLLAIAKAGKILSDATAKCSESERMVGGDGTAGQVPSENLVIASDEHDRVIAAALSDGLFGEEGK